jgi:predicted P-loop ATPase
VLGFNEFSLGTVALKAPAWQSEPTGKEWTDHEDRLAADWLQHQDILITVEVAGQAVQAVARDRCFHPVKDYVNSLSWDGVKRIDVWLSQYLGAELTDYSKAMGARWLISAVARIYNPGAKADCCLILEGEQGTNKSTALRILAGDWFTDEIAELGSKDAAMQTRGVWIIEIAELDSMSRTEVGKIKAFMSRAVDRFRPPYGKRLVNSPRQCVFAGSVNHRSYLRDETGGRRFWPVACGSINIEDLARDRDQLWAEARDRFRSGSPWWLETRELTAHAEEEQADRESGFLPTGPVGVVNLGQIPDGLNAEELERLLRKDGAEICGLRARHQSGARPQERASALRPLLPAAGRAEPLAAGRYAARFEFHHHHQEIQPENTAAVVLDAISADPQ